jgi:ADP-ribosylglycohydrolase
LTSVGLAEHEQLLSSFISPAAKSEEISHKKTLFHTGAHFSGWALGGQALSGKRNWDFINEIKDLAHFFEAS